MAGRSSPSPSDVMTTYGDQGEPIAIIGSGCRFAGDINSPSSLWEKLKAPSDFSKTIPPDRFNIKGFYNPDGEYNGATNSPKAYFLEQNFKEFDASFFSLRPKEAEAIDPQQRLLLEVVYEALESAGYTLQKYKGRPVAVYAGIMTADYDTVSQRDDLNTSQYYATGNARSIVSNRISYFFDWKGPSMTIDTACSSSLVALDQAIANLRSGRSELACVTGANLILTPEQFIAESSLHMLSPTGHSRMWDKDANGYARGEGVTAIFVKTLSQALQDNDRIEAVIRDIGVNSDGRTQGITMPSPKAQSQLIQDVYYFEAHGTGTPAGDPREAEAIQDAFFTPDKKEEKQPTLDYIPGFDSPAKKKQEQAKPEADLSKEKLLVGSIKTVLGHTEGAAGLAGVLKVVQLMRHGKISPNLHHHNLNPNVAKVAPNLKVATELLNWPTPPPGEPKRASVNSFGFGGTNAHVILEEYDEEYHGDYGPITNRHKDFVDHRPMAEVDQPPRLPLLLSAPNKDALARLAEAYSKHLSDDEEVDLNELAWHLYNNRTAFPTRAFVSGTTHQDVVRNLKAVVSQVTTPSPRGPLITRARAGKEPAKILGIFTGQGAQWATMGAGLLRSSKYFRQTIQELSQVLKALPDGPTWNIEGHLEADKASSQIDVPAISQPLCTAVQIALVKLLTYIGVDFCAVVGHSSGEIAAAYTAGRITAEHAMAIAYYRGLYAHLASNPETKAAGGMLAAALTEEEARDFCENDPRFRGRIWIAAINTAGLVTLSGDVDVVKALVALLTERKIFHRELAVTTAYHSPHMTDPAVEYTKALSKSAHVPLPYPRRWDMHKELRKPIPWFSTVTGENADEIPEDKLKAEYWRDNMTQPVLFLSGLEAAVRESAYDCAVEVGPSPALRSSVLTVVQGSDGGPLPYSPLLSKDKDDRVLFADFMGFMWAQFNEFKPVMARFVKISSDPGLPKKPRLGDLPTYPWDHSQEFYRESRVATQYHQRKDSPHELLGVRGRDDNEFLMRWRNVLILEQLPWGTGHTFQGMHLVPGSGYCSMAYDAAKFVLAGRQASVIELLDLRFHSGITLEPKSVGVETLFSLTIDDAVKEKQPDDVIEGSFTLTSCPADGSTNMKMNFSGKLRIYLEEPTLEALPARVKVAPETTAADPVAFYTMMAGTGLEYTGPFKGLTALQKRTHFASGTVKQLHNEDQTTLTVSPATLDSCLQTAFVTVASPGDKSLWTSFLPDTITRMRFNVASCEGKNNDKMLTVDAYLTDSTLFTHESRASFTADIEIFGQEDRLQVQVEGLTVASFSTTKPEEDYELYLTTKWDVDPDEEIISAPAQDLLPEKPLRSLIESCERVVAFYDTKQGRTSLIKLPPPYSTNQEVSSIHDNAWPNETQESLDAFIKKSRYFGTLDVLRVLGDMGSSGLIRGMLEALIEEAQFLVALQDHVSRIVKQIAHKYPRMQIMGITDPGLGLTAAALDGLDMSFLSYRVGANPEKYLEERLLTTPARRKKVSVAKFVFGQDSATNVKYDLVLVSTSLIKAHGDQALQQIRSAMRPGAFLILLDSSHPPLLERLATAMTRGDDDAANATNWQHLLDQSGFKASMVNSSQTLLPGYSVTIRQVDSYPKSQYRDPMKYCTNTTLLANRVLVVGGTMAWTGAIEDRVIEVLEPYCIEDIDTAKTLSEIDMDLLPSYTAVIMLAEIDGPVLANLSGATMDTLKAMMLPEMKILWITHKARTFTPDAAASIGFIRTLLAEVPSLDVQVLDLDTIDPIPATDTIMSCFVRLLMPRLDKNVAEDQRPLWVYETEVYMERGRQYIARCLPWKEANNRNNAPRRLVFDPVNSLDDITDVSFVEKQDGSSGYEMQVDKSYKPLDVGETSVVIKTSYSTADGLDLGRLGSAYVSLGRDVEYSKIYVALSSTNASYIKTPAVCTHRPDFDKVNQPILVALLARYVSALTIANELILDDDESLMVIEPDAMFHACLQETLADCSSPFVSVSTDANRCAADPALTYIHANSSTREIKALYHRLGTSPRSRRTVSVIDMQPTENEITRILRSHLPKGGRYEAASSVLTGENHVHGSSAFAELWQEAVDKTMAKLGEWQVSGFRPQLTTVKAMTERTGQLPPFQIIDWKAERSLLKQLTWMPPKNILSPDKAYILVGITRDLGQSLSYLFADYGARHIILCSRNPPSQTNWQKDMASRGVRVQFFSVDVTDPVSLVRFKQALEMQNTLAIGGVVNGAMVLEDKVFATMSVDTLHRVMRPKTVGSKNLDLAFRNKELEFFIMTSSFAAIGGHAGQSNYAAANMFMNGLAAKRRAEGVPGSTLNIGVIYGIGFLHREKSELYTGLSREGYPPISERDIHHMFLEAIEAGKPKKPGQVYDIITGLSRYDANAPEHHWQQDPRFSHFAKPFEDEKAGKADEKSSVKDQIAATKNADEIYDLIRSAFFSHLQHLLQLSESSVNDDATFGELGVDSLVAVDVRNWFYKNLGQDVAVMKILGSPSIKALLREVAEKLAFLRAATKAATTTPPKQTGAAAGQKPGSPVKTRQSGSGSGSARKPSSSRQTQQTGGSPSASGSKKPEAPFPPADPELSPTRPKGWKGKEKEVTYPPAPGRLPRYVPQSIPQSSAPTWESYRAPLPPGRIPLPPAVTGVTPQPPAATTQTTTTAAPAPQPEPPATTSEVPAAPQPEPEPPASTTEPPAALEPPAATSEPAPAAPEPAPAATSETPAATSEPPAAPEPTGSQSPPQQQRSPTTPLLPLDTSHTPRLRTSKSTESFDTDGGGGGSSPETPSTHDGRGPP
ncbi:beta-ketoacyl synthase domain-containing protein [Rhypophila decipiens]|uniref:Beta-ketoacyl synthase domain-containing protein n=1 Tax=Rhypophila decipiens TaxID=261697 RepID=A0AAN6Y2P4_9PEZI|nr:beta-ketoacyl synthase domain-containing protein [Rhypophila decipiens]